MHMTALGKRWLRPLLLAVLLVVGVFGAIQLASWVRCTSGECPHSGTGANGPGAAQITITPGPNAHDVDPVAAVMVKADAGKLTDVRMVNENGKVIQGVTT